MNFDYSQIRLRCDKWVEYINILANEELASGIYGPNPAVWLYPLVEIYSRSSVIHYVDDLICWDNHYQAFKLLIDSYLNAGDSVNNLYQLLPSHHRLLTEAIKERLYE